MAGNFFGKVAADTLGLSDIGKIIEPRDFDKVDGDDYIMHEDGEKIYFVIKSKSDEYVFTNRGLLHVDGASAVSKKRVVKRHDFYYERVSYVTLETAGTVDLDVEIKFNFGETRFSIDVDKRQIEKLKDLYKALVEIGRIQGKRFPNQSYSYRESRSISCKECRVGPYQRRMDTVSWRRWLHWSKVSEQCAAGA